MKIECLYTCILYMCTVCVFGNSCLQTCAHMFLCRRDVSWSAMRPSCQSPLCHPWPPWHPPPPAASCTRATLLQSSSTSSWTLPAPTMSRHSSSPITSSLMLQRWWMLWLKPTNTGCPAPKGQRWEPAKHSVHFDCAGLNETGWMDDYGCVYSFVDVQSWVAGETHAQFDGKH